MCVQQPSFHPVMPLPQSTEKRKEKKPLLQPLEWNTLEEKRDESEPYFSLNAKIPMIHSDRSATAGNMIQLIYY